MKKFFTLLLVLAGCVSTANADWYVTGMTACTNSTSDFQPGDAANKMTHVGDGIYKLTVTGKTLNAGYWYKYKITNGTWDETYGWDRSDDSYNAYFVPHLNGTYDITYIFDSNNPSNSETTVNASALLKNGPDVYLHCNGHWESDDAAYKFTNTNGVYTLDLDVSNITENFYFRFHVSGWDNDCGTNGTAFTIDNGLMNYDIYLDNGNYYGKDDNHTFGVTLGSKPCAKLSFSLKFINRAMTTSLKSYEKVTTNSSGYCTFVNNYPLSIPASTAYYATDRGNGSATAVAMTNPVAGVPMIIKGTPSAPLYFEVVATGTDEATGNAFKAGPVDDLASNPSTGVYNYILNGDTFKAANGKNVGEGKAYLQLSAAATGARVLIFDDEDVTAIEAVTTVNRENNAYYNIAGQRVAQPTKGLYIVNGKKVIIK